MTIPRKKTTTPEIPLTSTSDVAFLLLIFFLVAASNAVDSGRPFDLPNTTKQQSKQTSQNIEVAVSPTVITFNGEPLRSEADLLPTLQLKLAGVTDPALRVVAVTADPQVDYQRWSNVVSDVETAGGIVAPQREQEEKKSEEEKAAAAQNAQAPATQGGTP